MFRVSFVQNIERCVLKDKKGLDRKIRLYVKNGNIYIGPMHSLFNRNFVCKDKNRMEFSSKLDINGCELMHVDTIFKKIKKHVVHSNFTEQILKDFLFSKGYTEEDLTFKDKVYTCGKEHFIEYGFNSMNVCLDRREDIWVHYKEYEEQKQYAEIIKALPEESVVKFRKVYKNKMLRFIRYANINDNGTVDCFALKSINISKLYRWLTDEGLIHKVNYVVDIYHEAVRVIELANTNVDNTYIKVVVTENGIVLKESNLGYNC